MFHNPHIKIKLDVLFCRSWREFRIRRLWNGGLIDHAPMIVRLDQLNSDGFVKVTVSGPFFGDVAPPSAPGELICGSCILYCFVEIANNDKQIRVRTTTI